LTTNSEHEAGRPPGSESGNVISTAPTYTRQLGRTTYFHPKPHHRSTPNRTPVRYTVRGQPHSPRWTTHPTAVDQPLPSVEIPAPGVDRRRMRTKRPNHHI
jgi:hypothetical protein